MAVRIVTAVAVVGCLLAVAAPPVLAQQRVVVEERSATILKVVGTTVILRNDKGEIKRYSSLPENFTLTLNGQPAKLSDLREGMVVQAVRFQDVPPPTVITMAEVEQLSAEAPASAPASAPAAAPRSAAPASSSSSSSQAASLPPTGSVWPTVGLVGALLLLAGLGLRGRSRRAHA